MDTPVKSVMPTLFVGHGSPMNAIQQNKYTHFLRLWSADFPRPKAILVISAHWVTRGLKVQRVEHPKTIHDFSGFPEALFQVQYPAPGSLFFADQVVTAMTTHGAQADSTWGLDHGTWSVLRHIYPNADVPVLQLSLNANWNLQQHLEAARTLAQLREQGVLVLGSGNITHNLRTVNFADDAKPEAWAIEFDQLIKKALEIRDESELLAEKPEKAALWKQAHPSIEHYLPLIYTFGTARKSDDLHFPYEEIQNGTLSMRAVRFG
jgi:4,5-DOPA dioxygenase extradiol